MEAWKEARLLVLGDTIVDQYAACEAIGMSAEAPVIVVKELQNKNFIGGAAVVASHINSLGAKFISQISRNADILICGENPGNKLEKAEQLSIKIINEQKLNEYLKDL